MIDKESLKPGIDWKYPATQLTFLRVHSLLLSVVFIFPDYLRWNDDPDARLIDPKALITVLVECGWRTPLLPDASDLAIV